MTLASFKHPKKHRLIYQQYLQEKDVPKELSRPAGYLLYGIHSVSPEVAAAWARPGAIEEAEEEGFTRSFR